jgi:lipopolysaccharide transport protein LptA
LVIILFYKIEFSYASDFHNIHIKSEIIDIKRNSQNITFQDNVIIESGDDSLLADKMNIIYDVNKNIDKIKAYGNIKIFTNNFNATAKKGYYDPKKDLFILKENVIVNDGLSIASGDEFMYDLRNQKGIFIGQRNESKIKKDHNRVKVIISNE